MIQRLKKFHAEFAKNHYKLWNIQFTLRWWVEDVFEWLFESKKISISPILVIAIITYIYFIWKAFFV